MEEEGFIPTVCNLVVRIHRRLTFWDVLNRSRIITAQGRDDFLMHAQ